MDGGWWGVGGGGVSDTLIRLKLVSAFRLDFMLCDGSDQYTDLPLVRAVFGGFDLNVAQGGFLSDHSCVSLGCVQILHV